VTPKPRRPRVITRISGCPHCLKYNTVATHWTRYLCGHCKKPVECGPSKPNPEAK
jgi:ribosomal protein S27AE